MYKMENKEKGSVKIPVRYNECDPTGYAFNANYFIWMQLGASDYFKATGIDLVKLALSQHTFMAVHLSCDYKRPVTYLDVIEVRPFLKNLSDSSIHIQYDIYKGDELVAVGNTIHVYIDLKTKKKIPITEELREKFIKTDHI